MKNEGFSRTLFEYITMKAGFTLKEAAAAMGLSLRSLRRRMKGEVSFRLGEVLEWLELVKSEGPKGVLAEHVFRIPAFFVEDTES